MKIIDIQMVIRITLAIVLMYFSYQETGWFTVIIFSLLLINSEAQTILIKMLSADRRKLI